MSHMNRCLAFAVLLLLMSSTALGATRIAYQNFEDASWKDEFTGESSWVGWMARVGYAPSASHPLPDLYLDPRVDEYSGYALRWNQDSVRFDPITGRNNAGHEYYDSTLLDWRGNFDIASRTPNELYFSMRFRHDDYNNDAEEQARKLFYCVDQTYNVGAMLVGMQAGNAMPRLSYENGGYSEAWAITNWGNGTLWFNNSNVSPSLDGDWRQFEFYINYSQHYVQLFLDGYVLYPNNSTYWGLYPEDAAAGRIRLDPSLNLRFIGFQIGYFDQSRDCLNCADQTGYYAGFQIDELEIWDGFPDSTPDNTAPPIPTWTAGSYYAGDGFCYLDWNPVTDEAGGSGLAGYEVFRSDGDADNFVSVSSIVQSEWTDTYVTNGTKYFYKVRSRDYAGNNSELSAYIDLTPTGSPLTLGNPTTDHAVGLTDGH